MIKNISYNSLVDGRSWLLSVILTVVMVCCNGHIAVAQNANMNRLSLGAGLLYERGLDATIAVEHETRYHNMWEFFATGYLKWDKDPAAGHVTKKSFWNNYNSWCLGIAYKPCVNRGRNHFGNFRIGGGAGSDLHQFIGLVTVGYEHSYFLRGGWCVFFQLKEDVAICGKDLFRTGVVLGVKVPLNK